MHCQKCGFEIRENSKFCRNCGAVIGDEQKKKKKKGFMIPFIITSVLLLFAIALIMVLLLKSNVSSEATFQGVGYNEPEEVAEAYIEAYQAGDLEAMLSCFAIESYVEAFDVEMYLESVGSYYATSFYTTAAFPTNSGEYQDALSLYNRVGTLVQRLYLYHVNTYKPELYNDGSPMILSSDDLDIDDLMMMLEDTDYVEEMEEMEVIEYYTAEEFLKEYDEESYDIYISENMISNMSQFQERYGVEDFDEICVIVELDGEEYVVSMQLGCYNDKWYIIEMGGVASNLMGISSVSKGMFSMDSL